MTVLGSFWLWLWLWPVTVCLRCTWTHALNPNLFTHLFELVGELPEYYWEVRLENSGIPILGIFLYGGTVPENARRTLASYSVNKVWKTWVQESQR